MGGQWAIKKVNSEHDFWFFFVPHDLKHPFNKEKKIGSPVKDDLSSLPPIFSLLTIALHYLLL